MVIVEVKYQPNILVAGYEHATILDVVGKVYQHPKNRFISKVNICREAGILVACLDSKTFKLKDGDIIRLMEKTSKGG